MGHTADDLAEGAAMRRAGVSAPLPRVWSPSPAWPEGRGVFLLRPLLARRRSELRELLGALGESWIDDPANDDPRFARALARRRLAGGDAPPPPAVEALAPWRGLGDVRQGPAGELAAPRALLAGQDDETRRAIGALAVCAAGTARAPAAASLGRIAARLVAGEDFAASLAGARIEAGGGRVVICREAGERLRHPAPPAPLALGESVFDGRFVIDCALAGHRIGFLGGHAARLPADQRQRLTPIPAAARGALPAAISPDGAVTCPVLASTGAITARPLTFQRLAAALGAIGDEAALWRVAKLTAAS